MSLIPVATSTGGIGQAVFVKINKDCWNGVISSMLYLQILRVFLKVLIFSIP